MRLMRAGNVMEPAVALTRNLQYKAERAARSGRLPSAAAQRALRDLAGLTYREATWKTRRCITMECVDFKTHATPGPLQIAFTR
jgi:hypothetical protein